MLPGVVGQLPPVRFVLLPGDVPLVSVRQERVPLLARQELVLPLPIGPFALMADPVGVGAGIAGVAQDAGGTPAGQRLPDDFSLAQATLKPRWEFQITLTEQANRAVRRADLPEGIEQKPHGLLDLLIGIDNRPFISIADIPGGQAESELSASGLV